jgi:tripeptide aminopeptidase
VVAERCTIEGEARSFDPAEIDEYLKHVAAIFDEEAGRCGATVAFESSVDFAPFVLSSSNPAYLRTCAVLSSLGLDPYPIEYLGGSDANMLNAGGIPSVNLGIGAQNPHGNDEFILIEDLIMATRIAESLVGGESAYA